MAELLDTAFALMGNLLVILGIFMILVGIILVFITPGLPDELVAWASGVVSLLLGFGFKVIETGRRK